MTEKLISIARTFHNEPLFEHQNTKVENESTSPKSFTHQLLLFTNVSVGCQV